MNLSNQVGRGFDCAVVTPPLGNGSLLTAQSLWENVVGGCQCLGYDVGFVSCTVLSLCLCFRCGRRIANLIGSTRQSGSGKWSDICMLTKKAKERTWQVFTRELTMLPWVNL